MKFKTLYNAEEKVWTGLQTVPFYNEYLSAGQAILNSLELNPNQIGQISDNNGMVLTNNDIKVKMIRVAINLQKMGINAEDVVGIIATNHHYLAPVVFACLSIEAPVNTLDPSFKPSEIIHIWQLTKPKIVFCDASNVLYVRESLKMLKLTVPIFSFGGKVDGARMVEELFIPCEDEEIFSPAKLKNGSKTIAAILCSSGTTGVSKAVSLTHRDILENLVKMLPLAVDDVLFSFSSLYWLSGFSTLIITTINSSTRIITTEQFSPELFINIVEKYKVTVTVSSPSYVALLLQSDRLSRASLSSIKIYWCGGSYVSQEICERMNKYLTNGCLQVAYGMTEIGGLLSMNTTDKNLKSVGKLCANSKVKLIDNNGQKCDVNQIGEICSKYPFAGYYGDIKTTKEIMDDDGWIHSGDIGYFDDDGFLYIIDRKKDILKYMNYQISPTEIEEVIFNCDGVSNVCVVGIDDPIKTDLPAAVVVGNKFASTATAKEIKDLVKEKLSDFKQLRGGVYFVDILPMTPSGKILRRKVKDIATNLWNKKKVY